MKIDRGIVRCDRCKRVFKTKEVNNYKISYQAGGLKSDGGNLCFGYRVEGSTICVYTD